MTTQECCTIDGTIIDGKIDKNNSCVVYKFRSRPPYEGYILILSIVVIAIILIWWLHC